MLGCYLIAYRTQDATVENSWNTKGSSRHVKLLINLNSSIFNRCGEKLHHGRNKWIMLLSLDSQTSHGQLSSNLQMRFVTFMIFLLCNPARDGASSTTFPGTSSVIHESVHVAAAAIWACPELPALRNSRQSVWWGLSATASTADSMWGHVR